MPDLIDIPYIKINGTNLTVAQMNQLERIEIEQTLDLPAMCTLTFNDDSNLTLIDGSTFAMGAALNVSIKARAESETELFNGEIVVAQPEYDEGDQFILTVIAYDKMHRLNRETKSKVFLQVKDSDIVSQIAGNAGLQAQMTATSQIHQHVFQDNVTDFAFVQYLAHRNGMQLRCDGNKIIVEQPSTTEVPLERGTNLLYFRPRVTLAQQVNEAKVKSWDVQSKQAIVGSASTSSSHPQIGIGNWGGAAAQSAFSGRAATHTEVMLDAETQTVAQKYAEARLDEINSHYIEAEGRAFGDTALKPGVLVNITKLGTKFSGKYRLTTVRHVYENGLYETHFTIEGAKPRTLLGSGAAMQDPPRLWMGAVPAIVTKNIDTSDQAQKSWPRVKVKFPWLDDTLESEWARVMGIGAGNSRGLQIIPEVNDEVLVVFENGNFNKPIVIGGLWNGSDASPEAKATVVQDGKVEHRLFKTREGHILRFVDKQGEQKIELKEKNDHSILLDGQNKKIEIKTNGGHTVTMDDTAKKIEIVSAGGHKIVMDDTAKKIEVNSGGELDIKSTGPMNIESTAILTIKGSMVKIN